ncbi:hypothetical protein CHARACLAT_001457 [Characodon lateralis]|uniref:Uncharacterized protein n=1 Tax=Characodon lateralis TaxID=208331 RepID=A0ABU7EZN5_9TELE|nr:hypothetical protein [Characodon lateralis]
MAQVIPKVFFFQVFYFPLGKLYWYITAPTSGQDWQVLFHSCESSALIRRSIKRSSDLRLMSDCFCSPASERGERGGAGKGGETVRKCRLIRQEG